MVLTSQLAIELCINIFGVMTAYWVGEYFTFSPMLSGYF